MGNDISSLLSRYGRFYINGTLATIVLSLVGTFGGLFLGIFLAFGKSLNTKESPWYHKIWRFPIKWICNIYSIVIRGTPMMVQCYLNMVAR